ncbi:MAG: hypothetical protein H7641_00240 [Candidatus Heimdallarchaeota archaeon]|nr:hypothetical protein [Candidatus Heimdallarchaeota archaeon]MCK4875992.1 hypothetical protein [Candidatus Heimdallarchaeota archaeon]
MAPAIIQAEDLERIEESKEGIIFARKRIKELENSLIFLNDLYNQSLIILLDQLKDKQQHIFFAASRILTKKNLSLNKLSDMLSERFDLSFSTIKWNLTKLRDIGLFETFGERGNTKTILMLTHLGLSLYSNFAQTRK